MVAGHRPAAAHDQWPMAAQRRVHAGPPPGMTAQVSTPGAAREGCSSLLHSLPPGVRAFAEFLDHLAAEGRDVVRPAGGDEALVRHYLLVHPLRPGIDKVLPQRGPAG